MKENTYEDEDVDRDKEERDLQRCKSTTKFSNLNSRLVMYQCSQHPLRNGWRHSNRGLMEVICLLDCIGSEFNSRGVMQCPHCRVIENGEWLFAAVPNRENDNHRRHGVSHFRRIHGIPNQRSSVGHHGAALSSTYVGSTSSYSYVTRFHQQQSHLPAHQTMLVHRRGSNNQQAMRPRRLPSAIASSSNQVSMPGPNATSRD